MKTEKIEVFLSDPQVLFREGIHFTLSGEEDFEVTGETTNNEDAIACITDNPPTVAILNMKNGKLDGATATHRIKRSFPSMSVILIMDGEDDELIFSAIKSGASACLTKDTDPDYLITVIKEIVQGGQPIIEALLMPKMASRILEEFEAVSVLSEQLNNLLASLSPKEAGVLNSIAADNKIEQVADKLSSDEKTIRGQLRSIVNKLVANDQARVLMEAAQRSLPSIVSRAALAGKYEADYITRSEFNDFKENLMERLKSFIGELA